MAAAGLYGLLLMFAVLLQMTVFAAIPYTAFQPDLSLVLVVVLAGLNGFLPGAVFGFAAGLLIDVLVGYTIGLGAVVRMITGAVVGYLARGLYRDSFFLALGAIVAATWFDQLLYLIGLTIFGVQVRWDSSLVHVLLSLALYHLALTALVYRRLRLLNESLAVQYDTVRRTG